MGLQHPLSLVMQELLDAQLGNSARKQFRNLGTGFVLRRAAGAGGGHLAAEAQGCWKQGIVRSGGRPRRGAALASPPKACVFR